MCDGVGVWGSVLVLGFFRFFYFFSLSSGEERLFFMCMYVTSILSRGKGKTGFKPHDCILSVSLSLFCHGFYISIAKKGRRKGGIDRLMDGSFFFY